MPHVTACPLGGGQGSCCPVPVSTQSAPSKGHPLPPTALGGQKQPFFCLQFATSPSSWQRTPSLGRQQAAPYSSPWGFSDGKYGLCTGAGKESPSALHSQAEEMSWGPCSTHNRQLSVAKLCCSGDTQGGPSTEPRHRPAPWPCQTREASRDELGWRLM